MQSDSEYGKNEPRMRQFEAGCKAGVLDVYQDLMCNYATDMQITDYVEWIIKDSAIWRLPARWRF